MYKIQKISFFIAQLKGNATYLFIYLGLIRHSDKINLGSGSGALEGYCNIDLNPQADLVIDLEKKLLPFKDNTMQVAVCMSVINYFTLERGQEIINDVFRALKPGGIARFGVQDLDMIARRYVEHDISFWGQKRADGTDRFRGATVAEKFNAWFYGYPTPQGKGSKFFYDYETLALLFKKAGFTIVERKQYHESKLPDVADIDNRPEQMFFLEAQK